ncbi:MAG: MerR family transcriptional regulator [Pelagibacterium sp. SCN 64-44]|nr:MAG: MerR family transcriptional regulator [Pelagibacterium sp. SCN 64-44]
MPGLKIGELAERTGTNTPTIRYYEGIGLLPPPERQEGNQRRYGDDAVKRLTFIRRCRDFGFSIEQVRMLTSLAQDRSRSCFEARDLAQEHLKELRVKLKELRELEKSIVSFVESCNVACAGGPGPDCVILDDLASGQPIAARRRQA